MSRLMRGIVQRAAQFVAGVPVRSAGSEEAAFRLLAESSSDTICKLSADLRVEYASPSALTLLGYSPEEMVGLGPVELIAPEDVAEAQVLAAQLTSGEAEKLTATVRMVRKDGSLVWVESTAARLRDRDTGAPLHSAVVIIRDVTVRKQLEQRLSELAHTDPLTELANRRAFDSTLTNEWARSDREGSCLSILLIDVDNFKRFNDRFGHQAGDDCLRAVAAAVQTTVRRPGDVAARYGGEELAVVLPGTPIEGALHLAEEIRAQVAALCIPTASLDPGKRHVSVSIGVAAAYPSEESLSAEQLLFAADSALYKAKRNGRNRVEHAGTASNDTVSQRVLVSKRPHLPSPGRTPSKGETRKAALNRR